MKFLKISFSFFCFLFFIFTLFQCRTNSFINSLVEQSLETHFHKNNYRGILFREKKLLIFLCLYSPLPRMRCILYEQQSPILPKVTRSYGKFKQVYLKVYEIVKYHKMKRFDFEYLINYFNNNRKHMTTKLEKYKVIRNMDDQNLLDKVTLMTEKRRGKIKTIKKIMKKESE